jgi:hypothetical protein
LSTAPARADGQPTKAQCIETNTRGQDLRRDGKLAAAREAFQACSAASCPTLVRNDCARRLDEIDTVQPTVVLVAKDGGGKDVSVVHVTVDGKPLTEKLDGTALPVDPGEHTFAFAIPGQPAVKATFVLALGEKNRREQVVVGGGVPGSAAGAAAAGEAGGGTHLTITTDADATISVDGQVVGKGRFDAPEAPGAHEITIAETGMRTHKATLELRDGETRTLDVTLEKERRPVWPWIVGGVALATGAAVGGYFLFKPQDTNGPPPMGTLGTAFIRNSFGASR